MFIPYPRSWSLPIPDPGSKHSNNREEWKKISCQTFSCSHKFHKIKFFYFWNAEEKNLGQFSKNYITFYSKYLSLSYQKNGFGIRNPWSGKTYSGIQKKPIPGSGKNLFRIPDPGPGVKKAPDPGSGSATLKSSGFTTNWQILARWIKKKQMPLARKVNGPKYVR